MHTESRIVKVVSGELNEYYVEGELHRPDVRVHCYPESVLSTGWALSFTFLVRTKRPAMIQMLKHDETYPFHSTPRFPFSPPSPSLRTATSQRRRAAVMTRIAAHTDLTLDDRHTEAPIILLHSCAAVHLHSNVPHASKCS